MLNSIWKTSLTYYWMPWQHFVGLYQHLIYLQSSKLIWTHDCRNLSMHRNRKRTDRLNTVRSIPMVHVYIYMYRNLLTKHAAMQALITMHTPAQFAFTLEAWYAVEAERKCQVWFQSLNVAWKMYVKLSTIPNYSEVDSATEVYTHQLFPQVTLTVS